MIFTGLPFGLNGKVYRSVMPFGDYDREGTLIERYQKVGIDNRRRSRGESRITGSNRP